MNWWIKFKGYIATVGVFLTAVTLALFAGRRQGRQAQQEKQAAQAAKAQQEGLEARNDAKNEVNKMPDGGAADQLKRDWMRDE